MGFSFNFCSLTSANRNVILSSKDILTCVVVEDDHVALMVIEQMVNKTPFLRLQKSFTDPIKASQYLRENKVDLLLLDIEMPGINGFELIKLLDEMPATIIMTSEQKYAVEAFEYNVSDFLVKPVTDYSRFLKALYRIQHDRQPRPEPAMKPEPQNVFVKADSLLHNVPVNSILYIEAFGDYVKIHTETKVLMVLSTLKAFEEKIPSDQFLRVHRSYIVNVKKIDNIDPNNLQIATKIIPISPNYREELLGKINLL
jgi:DNA-binding LytR/AlgR family response regulator